MGIGIRGTFVALCVTLSGRAIMPNLPRDWALPTQEIVLHSACDEGSAARRVPRTLYSFVLDKTDPLM